MNITVIYPNKRKTRSVTFGIAKLVTDKLLCGMKSTVMDILVRKGICHRLAVEG